MSISLGVFKDLVQGLALDAIEIAGDLCVSVVYQPTGTIAYSPADGSITNTASALPAFNAFLSRFTDEEINTANNSISERRLTNIVNATDAKILIPALSMPGTTPNINDTMVTTDNSPPAGPVVKTWKVIKILTFPGSPFWKIQIRET